MIAFDTSAKTTGNGTSARTLSFTVASANNRMLIVHTNYSTGGLVNELGSVTYNGRALTRFVEQALNAFGDVFRLQVWYLVAPDTGANNLVLTPVATKTLPSASTIYHVASYSEVASDSFSQGVPIWTAQNATPTSNYTTTTVVNNAWVIGHLGVYTGTDAASAVTGNLRQQTNTGAPTLLYMDNGPVSPGLNGVSASTAGNVGWYGTAYYLNPTGTEVFIPQAIIM